MAQRGRRPRKIHLDVVQKLLDEGLSRSQIAREVGCSQGYISRLLITEANSPGGYKGSNPSGRSYGQEVLDYILEHGGTLRNAMMAMDLDVCEATVRDTAKRAGIKIADYRYYKLQRRNWLVYRPGYRKLEKHTNELPVECTECGHRMELNYMMFIKARPCACPNCGAD